MNSSDAKFKVGDAVWYGGYEHRVAAVLSDGRLRVVSDRPGSSTAFDGRTHQAFVSHRAVSQQR